MAKQVQHDFSIKQATNIYPWDKWLDGNTWQIEQGQDFERDLNNMRTYLYAVAYRNGGTMKTASPTAGVIVFKFVPNTERKKTAEPKKTRRVVRRRIIKGQGR